MDKYRICTRCIMDTTDPDISFDEKGVCSHCHNFEKIRKPIWFPDENGNKILEKKISVLKKERAKYKYDCMIGLSGGVDSSYLAYILKKDYNLRMLAVHIDAGWNSELAVSNIENIVNKLSIDLYTHVVDWQEMKDLQLAFLKSGVVNQDTPQDHVFFAGLYEAAKKFKIKDFFVGYNIQTESVLPKAWQGLSAMDTIQLKYINKEFGSLRINKFPTVSIYDQYFYFPYIFGFRKFSPLNYIKYNKDLAKKIIIDELDWRDYGVKHGESKWTRFFQSYFLPTRYGYDKRRAHLSSLILAGEISREEALKRIEIPVYVSNREINDDKEYVAKKLGISTGVLDEYVNNDKIDYTLYPNAEKRLKMLSNIKQFLLKKIWFIKK